MSAIGFTQQDLVNLKAALASGVLRVTIGDREVIYRSQKDLIQAIRMVQQELNGVPADTVSVVQATFKPGLK